MINPALDDPRTVLHILNFKAALPILMAMFMSDCPRPCSVGWLCRRTGVQSNKTARESLQYLEEMRITSRSTIRTKDFWQLTDGAYQLPLPLAFEASSQSSLAASSQSRLPSSSQSAGGASSQLPLLAESSQSHQQRQRPDVGVERGKIYRASSYDDDVIIISDPEKQHHHTDSPEASQPGKIYRTETSRLLEQLGCDPPMPEKFAHVEAAVALAFYWAALPWAHTPIGFLRRRLEQGHEPPGEHLELARFWLALDDDGRDDFAAIFTSGRPAIYHADDLASDFDLSQAAAALAVELWPLGTFEVQR